jgi:hypothetical protein
MLIRMKSAVPNLILEVLYLDYQSTPTVYYYKAFKIETSSDNE